MKCPKCSDATLISDKIQSNNIELDRCPVCQGLWFDNSELESLSGYKAETDLSVPDHAIQKHDTLCPKCNKGLFEFCYPGTTTLVDVCKNCSGIWLDNREWKEIKAARSAENQMYCPECATRQVKSDRCIQCGTVFAKHEAKNESTAQTGHKKALAETVERESYARRIPGIKGKLLRFIDLSIEVLTDY